MGQENGDVEDRKILSPWGGHLLRSIPFLMSGHLKGWLAIAKLKPLSLFISLFSMLKKAFDNVKIDK